MAYRKVTVFGGNLHALAAQYLGDATQAVRIAAINGMTDWFLNGETVLNLPPVDMTQTGGVPSQS